MWLEPLTPTWPFGDLWQTNWRQTSGTALEHDANLWHTSYSNPPFDARAEVDSGRPNRAGREKRKKEEEERRKKNTARSKPRSNSLPADFIAINFFLPPPPFWWWFNESLSKAAVALSCIMYTAKWGKKWNRSGGGLGGVRRGLISSFCLFSPLRLSPNSALSRCRLVMLAHAVHSQIQVAAGAAGRCSTLRLNLTQSRARRVPWWCKKFVFAAFKKIAPNSKKLQENISFTASSF